MTAGYLTWSRDDSLHWVEASIDRATMLGRAAGADVLVTDPAVSRQQAQVVYRESGFVVADLGGPNPTKLNGSILDGPGLLHDLDRISFGNATVWFHDLHGADRPPGPICSHCGRENPVRGTDCWYCGTSLVSARTQVRSIRRLAARVISMGTVVHDVYPSAPVVIDATGTAHSGAGPRAAGGVASVESTGQGSVQVLIDPETAKVTVNGADVQGGQVLRQGDELQVGDARFLVLVRPS